MRLRPFLALVAVAAPLACGGDRPTGTGTGPAPRAGLTILSGAGAADTALAPLDDLLRVQLRDASLGPVRGALVRFTGAEDPTVVAYPRILVCAPDVVRCLAPGDDDEFYQVDHYVYQRTDANGVAAARVRLGTLAGAAEVTVRVDSLDLRDTSTFTVRPGAGTQTSLSFRDGAVYVGEERELEAERVDQHGNPVTQAFTFESGSPAVLAVDATGRVTGRALGRGMVIARSAVSADTAWLTVVPAGRIAATFRYTPYSKRLSEFTTNLAAGSEIVYIADYGSSAGWPRWAPNGRDVVYVLYGSGTSRLQIRNDAGTRRLTPDGAEAIEETAARYSADGAWLFFGGREATGRWHLYRASADGSSVTRVADAPDSATVVSHPAPSADGTRLAYAASPPTGAAQLHVVSLASGESRALGLEGRAPAWAPTGERIAYVAADGGVMVTTADGAAPRRVSAPGLRYASGVDWSPDGLWLVAVSHGGTLDLINVESGQTLPLHLGWPTPAEPSWAP